MSSARAYHELESPAPCDTPYQEPDPSRPVLKRDMVAGLEKGLAVIEVFGQDSPRLTISEVAQAAGLTRAAARRYLLTLAHLGLVTQDRKMFMLTPRVLRLGQSYLQSAPLPRQVGAELHRVAQTLGESCCVSMLDGEDAVCVAAAAGGRQPLPGFQAGERLPLHCSAQGRVLLVGMGPSAMETWLARQGQLHARTVHTVTQTDKLRVELARVRLQGHAAIEQESEPGMLSLAVPLRNHRGETVAALSIQASSSRWSLDRLHAEALPQLRQAQQQLAMLL